AVKFAAACGCDVTAFTASESQFDEAKGFGANHAVSTKESVAIKKLGGTFDLLISTVNVKLDWDAIIGTLAPNGRLHDVGVVLEPIPVPAFSLISQQPSVSGSPTGSPVALAGLRDDARLGFTAQYRAAERALPNEQDQRSLRPTRIRQGPLPHRAGFGFLIRSLRDRRYGR